MAKSILLKINIIIFVSLALINLVGVFLPELGFDALWYHLTLSKLFLAKGQWYFPGGLFYYSAMPRLAELISLPLFSLLGAIGPKFTQYASGLITVFIIFKLSLHFSKEKLLAWVGVNLFYATWLVSWQSSSGYVDLVRTMFETTALYFLVKSKILNLKSKIAAGVFLGLAIGTKWHALGSMALYALIFSPLVILPSLVTASPWFFIAHHFTGNPIYPILEDFMARTQLSQVPTDFLSPFSILSRFIFAPVFLTRPSEDFLSPVIGLVFLVGLAGLISLSKVIRRLALIGLLGTFYLLLTPPPSTRYFLPFLPAVIISSVYIFSKLKEKITHIFVVLFTLSAMFILVARLVSLWKYLPFVDGRLFRNQFLAGLSYRLPNTFIDTDNYVSNNLPPDGRYLISNQLHNLYYFPYDFDHESFATGGEYDYLITKGEDHKKIGAQLIHTNSLGIQIFEL